MITGFLPIVIFSALALSSVPDSNALTRPPCVCDVLTLDKLAASSWAELDALYRLSTPGRPPTGELRGRAIYNKEQSFAKLRSTAAQAIWLGKEFDQNEGMLINRWRFGRAIKAQVYPGQSYLDGCPTLVMDYRHTSPVLWRNVRDELREVAPGLYLGVMFRCESKCARFGMFFALEECSR
jgi:hypothetical protein